MSDGWDTGMGMGMEIGGGEGVVGSVTIHGGFLAAYEGIYDNRGGPLHVTQFFIFFRMVVPWEGPNGVQLSKRRRAKLGRGDRCQPGGNFLDQRIGIGTFVASGQGLMCTECEDEAGLKVR